MRSQQIDVLNLALESVTHHLRISLGASLEKVDQHPECPLPLRETLQGSISWQRRVGITVEQALRSANLASQWIAALLALGARLGPQEVILSAPNRLPRFPWMASRRLWSAPSMSSREFGSVSFHFAHERIWRALQERDGSMGKAA